MIFCVRPQTDFIRVVSSKLVLRGASRRPGQPFRQMFGKRIFCLKNETEGDQTTFAGCPADSWLERRYAAHARVHVEAADVAAAWRGRSCGYWLLLSARNNGQRAKTSRKVMRERVPPFQNSKNLYAKWAAKPPTFGALFPSFGRVVRARA